MLYLDESNNEHEIELGVGEEFELHLPENPTTGFRWKCLANGGSACVLQSDNFESAGRTPGRGGIHLWRFKAVQVGLANFDFVYQRSFEPADRYAKRFRLRARIHQ
jgi:inhibitor of cysteine peptidase